MKPKAFLLAAILAAASTQGISMAAEVSTHPVGFNKVICLPGSDTYCSVPFSSETPFVGGMAAVPSVANGTATITAAGNVSWTADQFKELYFVRLKDGPKAGVYFQILSNTGNQLVVDLAGADVGDVTSGTAFKISKFWTLSTLFPPASQTTVVPSNGNLLSQRRTEILLPDNNAVGINIPAASIYYVVGTTEWRRSSSGFPAAGNTILWPDTYFIVRHGHSAITASTSLVTGGTVDFDPLVCPLATQTSGPQDNFVTNARPVAVKLSDLGFDSTNFVSSVNNLLGGRRDQLLVYDNATVQLNKSPSAIYYRVGNEWRQSTSGFPVANDVLIQPGTGFIVQKYTAATASVVLWKNNLPQ